MQALKTALLSTLAAFGAVCGTAFADAYTFKVGEAIPLFDDSGDALSHVSLTDAKKDGTVYEFANVQNKNATIALTLTNGEQGDYLLSFLGAKKDNTTTYTVTVQGTGDAASYARTVTGIQDQTSGGWSIDSYGIEHLLCLDALPAGDFTLTLTANKNGSWAGHYGNFTIKNLSGNALDLVESSGNACRVKDQSYVKVLKNAGDLTIGDYSVGSTKNDDTVQFLLFSTNATGSAKYSFSFDVATYDNYPTVSWRLIGPGVNRTFSDRMPSTGNWSTYTNCTYNLGVLPNGAYTLTMSINSNGRNWAGNYKDFTFSTSGNIDVTAEYGLMLDADADWSTAMVSIESGAIIDLNGHNLTIGSGIDTLGGKVVFTNSVDETLSTVTIADPNNSYLYFGGNLRYVATGSATNFREYDSTGANDNTHTGGTVLSNLTDTVKFYCPEDFGAGNLVLSHGGKAYIPSTGTRGNYENFNGLEVYGTGNTLNAEVNGGNHSYDSHTIKFNGELSGDGELTVSNGWQPRIHFDGPTTNFTGKLIARYHYTQDYSWDRGIFFERAFTSNDGSASLEKAAVLMKNKEADARNRIYIAGNTSSLVSFPIGALTTEGAEADSYTNTVIYTYKDGVNLEVGARCEDGTFAGNVIQRENGNYATSLVKVGTGTWTLTGTNHVYGGTTTVKGGRLNIDSAEFTAGTEVIVTNAVLGGTGTIKVPITVKKDGKLAGNFTATDSVTFEAGSSIEVAADAVSTLTLSGDINVANLTVKLTGELDTAQEYTILTAGSGSSGKATSVVVDTPPTKGVWRTKWVAGEGDAKTLVAYFVKPGFVLIIQ